MNQSNAKLFRILVSALLWAFVFVATVYTVYHWYFPIPKYLFDDEWFVLPERIWYRSSLAWLKHLLFFPQTRNVWVGDHMLVRPGLFFWIWLQDTLVRSHREAQQFLLIGVALFSFTSFYLMIYREAGKILAVAGCLFAFACLPGGFLFTWAHINGYLFAMALYTFAMVLYSLDQMDSRRALAIAAMLFCAENFHEFVSVTLVLVLLFEFFCWRKNDRAASNLRLRALLIALGGYAVVCFVALVILRPPAIFSPTEVDAWQFSLDYLFRVFLVQALMILGILNDLIPFYLQPYVGTPIRLGIGVLLLLMTIGFYIYRGGKFNRKIALCLLPVAAMLVGLLLGRVATRGVVKVHYYPMFQFFLVMAVLLMVASLWQARSKWLIALGLVLIVSSVQSATFIGKMNEAREPIVAATWTAVQGIASYLRKHPDRCFGGIYDPFLRGDLNKAVNIELLESQCGRRPGRAVYFLTGQDGSFVDFNFAPAETSTSVMGGLGLAAANVELASYLANLTYNFQEEFQQLRHSGVIQLRPIYQKVSASVISATFHGSDSFPELYNVGLVIRGANEDHFIVLLDNVLRVLVKSKAGEVKEFSQSQIPELKSDFTLNIFRTNEGCMVFMDELLLTQSGKCMDGAVELGTFTTENGTPPESLVDLSYKPVTF
ncbi:MAG: hypothetical protein ACXVA9_02235 [Bdellovibrionales bacterium]